MVGCRKGAELWRRLRTRAFAGSLRAVSERATRQRHDEADQLGRLRKVQRRVRSRGMMTAQRDAPSKDVARLLASTETASPMGGRRDGSTMIELEQSDCD